jgi:hypothetical protein
MQKHVYARPCGISAEISKTQSRDSKTTLRKAPFFVFSRVNALLGKLILFLISLPNSSILPLSKTYMIYALPNKKMSYAFGAYDIFLLTFTTLAKRETITPAKHETIYATP